MFEDKNDENGNQVSHYSWKEIAMKLETIDKGRIVTGWVE